jgi:hypothetical protein
MLRNHLPAEDVRVFPAHRRRAADVAFVGALTEQQLVQDHTASGISTTQILAGVLRNPNSMATQKDIANARYAERRQDLSTRDIN